MQPGSGCREHAHFDVQCSGRRHVHQRIEAEPVDAVAHAVGNTRMCDAKELRGAGSVIVQPA